MTSTVHWIKTEGLGDAKLGLMARPRGNDWLEDEIRGLKLKRVDCLISLLESSEIWELGLQTEGELCKELGIEFINFPIKDVTTPKNELEFIRLAESLAIQIQQGKCVVIHCRMGIGRSSILTAAIMIRLAFAAKGIFEVIGKHRGLEVPDTEAQKEWLLKLAEQLVRNRKC